MTTAWFGPLKPWRIDTCPEIRLISAPGTKNGDTRRGPFSFSVMEVSAMEESPPMPDPIRQPVRSRLFRVGGRPARVPDRLIGGGHAIEDELVDLAGLLGFHPVVGIEGAVRAVAGA